MALFPTHFRLVNKLLARRYKTLLVTLVALIALPSFFIDPGVQIIVTYILQAAVMIAGINAVQESNFQLRLGILIGAGVIILNWTGIFNSNATITFYLSFMFFMLFYVFVAGRLLRMMFKTPNVSMGVLYAALNVYLLLGIIGGFAFMLTENLHPGSLNNLPIENITDPSKFIYFSFITLSTLGYGDITPATGPTETISVMLSTAGPLYLTVLVAMLVGRYLSHQHPHPPKSEK